MFQRGVENRTRDSSFPISRACRKFPVDHHPCVTYIDKDNFKQILRRFPKNIKNFSLKVPTMANGEGYYFFNSDRLPKRAPKVHAFRRHPGEIFWDFNSLELPFLGFWVIQTWNWPEFNLLFMKNMTDFRKMVETGVDRCLQLTLLSNCEVKNQVGWGNSCSNEKVQNWSLLKANIFTDKGIS